MLALAVACTSLDVPLSDPPAIGTVVDTGRPLADPAAPVDPDAAPVVTFANPVATGTPDPHVSRHGDHVFLVYSPGDRILLRRADTLLGLGEAEERELWVPPPETLHSVDLWGPELHQVDGRAVIYYSATDASFLGLSPDYRIWALRADAADPWTATWTHEGPIVVPELDTVAQHPTVFGNGGYLAWTGRSDGPGLQGRLFVAPLLSALSVGPAVELASPVEAWETDVSSVLEAPAVVERDGRRVLVYAASSCISAERALGILEQDVGDSPLDPSAWTRRTDPWLLSAPSQGTWALGQPGFVTSPDGVEDWLVYHAAESTLQGCGADRALHLNRVVWTSDGPVVDGPTGPATAIPAPGGIE
ncbi:MAG: family 43 glycosylhydrolase [Myxococcota bacterium]